MRCTPHGPRKIYQVSRRKEGIGWVEVSVDRGLPGKHSSWMLVQILIRLLLTVLQAKKGRSTELLSRRRAPHPAALRAAWCPDLRSGAPRHPARLEVFPGQGLGRWQTRSNTKSVSFLRKGASRLAFGVPLSLPSTRCRRAPWAGVGGFLTRVQQNGDQRAADGDQPGDPDCRPVKEESRPTHSRAVTCA